MPREKLPYMQWYGADCRKDIGYQSLSFHHRGIWRDLLDQMWESEQRGKLILNGKALSDSQIARLLGLTPREAADSIAVLLESTVASRCPDTGALMNRRIVREEAVRLARAEAGRKGGAATGELFFAKAKVQAKPKQNPDVDVGDSLDVTVDIWKRLGKIFHRRETTEWSARETVALGRVKIEVDDLLLVERYYAERIHIDKDFRRRDLLTLLNNWPGEVDRARARPKPKAKSTTSVSSGNGSNGSHLEQPVELDPVAHADFLRRLKLWQDGGRKLGAFPE